MWLFAATGTICESIELVIVQFKTMKFFVEPQIVLCISHSGFYCTGAHGHHVVQKIVHSYCTATETFQRDSLNPILSNGWLDRSVLTMWQWNSNSWQKSHKEHQVCLMATKCFHERLTAHVDAVIVLYQELSGVCFDTLVSPVNGMITLRFQII